MSFTRSPRPVRRRLAVLLAGGVITGGVLAGCGGGGDVDLASGLLPAEAFGPGAQVQLLSDAELQQGAVSALGSIDQTQVDPPECAAALEATQPMPEQFDDIAGQVVTAGTTVTTEVIIAGGPVAPFGDVDEQVAACPEVQVSTPQGAATVSLQVLEVPDIGDEAQGLAMSITASAQGHEVTLPALVGVVRDGDRTLTLVSLDSGSGSLDEAEFTALLAEAVQSASDALD